MKQFEVKWIWGIAFLLVLATGCKKKEEQAITVEQVPQVMDQAFKEAEPQINQQVTQAVASVQEQNPQALEQLQKLSARPELTVEQRRAADRAMYATLKKLQEAAKQGDQRAEKELKRYQATK